MGDNNPKIKVADFNPVYMALLQNIPLRPEIGSIDGLQVISLFGIIATIIISYSSLNQQRHASARESLEQLDDVTLPQNEVKIRPILHSYDPWPASKAVVKLKMYRMSDISDVSQLWSNFVLFPAHIFEEYNIATDMDGYLLTIDSAEPIEIRRKTDNLLNKINQECRSKQRPRRVGYDEFLEYYSGALDGSKEPVHEMIINFLADNGPTNGHHIEKHFSGEDIPSYLVPFALRDLVNWEEIEIQEDKKRNTIYSLKMD